MIGIAKRLLPLLLRPTIKLVAVNVEEEDLERLRRLKGQRVVLTPNHGGRIEPPILFYLSKLLEENFNYLAAREAFTRRPIGGWFMQRLGAYSVVRGTADRKSFRMTHDLLVSGKQWLVIFPEGEVCGHGDTVMPFHQGVVQLACWAYEDLVRCGDSPPLYFVPLGIKYFYVEDMSREIELSLRRLEAELGSLSDGGGLSAYERLRRVGEAVLAANERKYNVRPAKGARLDERVQHMKEVVVSRIENALGVSPRSQQPLLERIRLLFNTVERITMAGAEEPGYEQELQQQLCRQARGVYEDLSRVLRFIAVHDGYVRETLSAERFLDVLGLMELEVCKRQRLWGPRKAQLKVGKPLNLADYFACYQDDRQSAIRALTESLETSVRELLAQIVA